MASPRAARTLGALAAVLVLAAALSQVPAAAAASGTPWPGPPNRPGENPNIKNFVSQSFLEQLGEVLPLSKKEESEVWAALKRVGAHISDSFSYELNHGLFNSTPKSPQELFEQAYKGQPLDKQCIEGDWMARTYNGSCNWLVDGYRELGMKGTKYSRDTKRNYYADGISKPREGPNAREVSNHLMKKKKIPLFGHSAVNVGMVQFIIHDFTYSRPTESREPDWYIDVPKCDPDMDPECTGEVKMPFWRSTSVPGTGTNTSNPAEPMNSENSWPDLSILYGSTEEVGHKLRSFVHGKMRMQKTPHGDYPPQNDDPELRVPMINRGDNDSMVFALGDPRANQAAPLVAVYVLLLREHNRLCDILHKQNSSWSDERLFQTARLAMSAKISTIANLYGQSYFTADMTRVSPPANDGFSYYRLLLDRTFLSLNAYRPYPAEWLLGSDGVPNVISAEFSIGYRFHDFLPDTLKLIDKHNVTTYYDLARSGWNAPGFINTTVETVIRGLADQNISDFLSGVSPHLRSSNFSLTRPNTNHGKSFFDLDAWAVERERERGMPTFNEYFRWYEKQFPNGAPCPPRNTFEEFSSNQEIVDALRKLYKSPDEVDLIVGMKLDEVWLPGGNLPCSSAVVAIYALFSGYLLDRFGPQPAMLDCILEQNPLDCTPTNYLQELLWEPNPGYFFPRARKPSAFWVPELGLHDFGMCTLWNLITKNSDIKCLQRNPLYPVGPENPVVCDCPGENILPPTFFQTLAMAAGSVSILFILALPALVFLCAGRKWVSQRPRKVRTQ